MSTLRKELQQQNRILLAAATCAFIIFSLFNYRFHFIADLSYQNRYSLADETQQLLALLKDDIKITAFIEQKNTKKKIRKYFKPLLNYKKNITFTFINPVENPQKARELAYNAEQPIRMHYQDKTVELDKITKNSLHMALQKLINNDTHMIAFSSGFGERLPYDAAGFNYSDIVDKLGEYNFSVIETDIRQLSNVPENAAALVVAAPTEKFDTNTVNKITTYIAQGGNLLWLADTDSPALPEAIKTLLGIKLLDGVIVDVNSQNYIENKPDFVPIDSYQSNTILADLKTVSLFPQARGIQTKPSEFSTKIILQSSISSWTETGLIRGNIAYDEASNEVAGPVTIGLTLSKNRSQQQDQRIVFISDADFMANAYIGNGGNVQLALRLFKWLSYQQALVSIDTASAPDKNLSLSNQYFFAISLFYIIILPVIFLIIGLLLWYKRKKA